MGKRRNRQRGKQRQRLLMQFKTKSLMRTVDDEELQDKRKVELKDHLQGIKELKQDLLSRTVTVGNAKPLGEGHNLFHLKHFMELKFGPVQKCSIDRTSRKNQRFPRGRVQFHYKKDAEKVFGGKSLMEAPKVSMPCSTVGHRGEIAIWPCREYQGMVDEDLKETSVIEINTVALSLGHWFPRGKDAGADLPVLEECFRTETSTFVEEKHFTSHRVLSIDLERSTVLVDFTSQTDWEDNLNLFEFLSLYDNTNTKVIASFRFKDLSYPIELCQSQDGLYNLVFSLKYPPRLSSIQTNQATGYETRKRLTNIDGVEQDTFGHCVGYRLQVSPTEINRLMMNTKTFAKLQKFGLFRTELDSLKQAEPIRMEHVEATQQRRAEAQMALLKPRTGLILRSVLDNYSCYWFDVINDKVGNKNLIDLANQGQSLVVERLLAEMRDMHGTTRYPAKMFLALQHGGGEEDDEPPPPVSEFFVNLPRILMTPCRVCVTGFQSELSNRLVRKFLQKHGFSEEAFIRVTIGDENGDKLFSDELSDPVTAKIRTLVLDGIKLAGKTYYFLAYSSSQLKELSLWMVCPEHGWSVKKMRESMGDFSMCPTPSKYAARMGQCFSTTVDANSQWVTRFARELRVMDDLPDITSYDPETGSTMDHSDGAGLIRKEILEELMLSFPFGPKGAHLVSAIQIRYGGAKGVLMAWDFETLKNQRCRAHDVCLRSSMIKFKAPYDRLEVVNVATHIPYYLNRNVILLLSHHGLPAKTFLDLQETMITKLNLMLTDADVASTYLPRLSGPDNGLVCTLCHMLSVGLKPNADPFLFSCLHATRAHHLMNLRKKARIHIEQGAVLIGGIDELGLIPDGCVFVQVRRSHSGNQTENVFKPLVGPVMVTKHPVMHPGDIRMLQAVDVPGLRDKKNVILFSQYGERPEANKMSGSDLDGDQFAITWDERLFLRNSSCPMDYSPPTKRSESSDITDSSLINHFINHARNDNLGRISMLWMDHAVNKGDAGCVECLELAMLHSIAVDFPKSGIPAVLPERLKLRSDTPRAHWREKRGSPSFHCDSIVGKLYDQIVDEIKSRRGVTKADTSALAGRRYDGRNGQILFLGSAGRILKAKTNIYNPLLPQRLGWSSEDDLDRRLLDFAVDQRQQYESQLINLMNQYKINSEGEAVTGCILKYHKLHKRRRHDVSEEIRRQFRAIRNDLRTDFFGAVYHLCRNNLGFFDSGMINESEGEARSNNYNDEPDVDDLVWIENAATKTRMNATSKGSDEEGKHMAPASFACRLAAAYYIASYSPEMHVDGSISVLYSFPWTVVADVIAAGLLV